MEQNVLILTPYGRDAEVITEVLAKDGYACTSCSSVPALVQRFELGAGAALISEEALEGSDARLLYESLARQASWSDFPIILLLASRRSRVSANALATLEGLGNVVGLERPLSSDTIRRAILSALRARQRQYEARRQQVERVEEQKRLNETLESRIQERTKELAAANDRLMKEIHERAKVQAVLAQAQKMEALGQLTGGIAHDFNNLLNVIMGNAELIIRMSDDDRVRGMAQAAKRATERGAKLTGQLLTFSRRSNLNPKAVDAIELMRGMGEMLSLSLGTGVHFSMELEETAEAWVETDANQLELAILNLAINGRDAMPHGGELTFRVNLRGAPDETLAEAQYTVLSVTDNGSGISPELLSRVFDPFFTTKPVGKGTGLGLSQVYGIATQAGGVARIRSRVGEGTTVEIWLPSREKPLREKESEGVPDDRDGAQERILVIEDDTDVRMFLMHCLTILGYVAIEAPHGRAGLERLAEESADLMMVDFAMPDMNGIEVITQARRTHPHLPVILATGYADFNVAEVSISDYAVLRKPFQISELSAAIKTALSRARG